jgi:hypothetical protein
MTEQAHTPGPWLQSHRQIPDGMYSTEVYAKDGETIATIHWYPVKTDDGWITSRDGNARLIAAAPDMLAALQDIVRRNEIQHWFNLDLARAAIAKATGNGAAPIAGQRE